MNFELPNLNQDKTKKEKEVELSEEDRKWAERLEGETIEELENELHYITDGERGDRSAYMGNKYLMLVKEIERRKKK